MDHNDGRLADDATVLLTEWRGGHQDELTPTGTSPDSRIA